MMTLIFKYIFKRLTFATTLLTLVLVIAVWLTQSLRFLDMIVNRNVSLKGYFYLVGFLIPDLLVVILPICLFVSVLFFYNKFQSDHELSIWRSTGMSNAQIAKPALFLALLVTSITFIINVYILPPSFKHFKDMEHNLRQQFSGAMLQEGRFNTINNATVYIKQRYRSGRMEGVFLYNNAQKKPYTLFAQEGTLNTVDGGLFLVLKKGFRQERDPKTNHIQVFYFDTLNYDLSELTRTKRERTIRPYEKGITELLDINTDINHTTQAKYRAAAHQRILHPLLGFIYVLIALVFMLKSSFNRKGRSISVLGAIVFSFLFHIALTSCINSNGHFSGAIIVAYIFFVVTFLCLGMYLFEFHITKRKSF